MEGEIIVQGEPGRGSAFSACLPAAVTQGGPEGQADG